MITNKKSKRSHYKHSCYKLLQNVQFFQIREMSTIYLSMINGL